MWSKYCYIRNFYNFHPILDFLSVLESQDDREENTTIKTKDKMKIVETVDINVKLINEKMFKIQ